MSKNKNKRKGNAFELKVIKDLKQLELFPDAKSSRYASKWMDDLGVDIVETGDLRIQCKSVSKILNYHDIISNMKCANTKILLHKYTEKRNERFYELETYAIMKYQDFLKLLINQK